MLTCVYEVPGIIHNKFSQGYYTPIKRQQITFLNFKLNNLKGFKMKDNDIFNIKFIQGYI